MKPAPTTATAPSGTEVDAAVARWAAAAGVPVSVAQGPEPRASFGRRVLRGFLLGLAVALPLLAIVRAAEHDVLRLVLVCAVLLLAVRIVQQRKR